MTGDALDVRAAGPGDAATVRRLTVSFGAAGESVPDDLFEAEYARIVADDTWLLLLVQDAGIVRGYALAQDHGPGLRARFTTGRLRDLYVDPEVRRRGAGRALMAAVVTWTRARPLPMILDWQAPASAVDFYLRLGFPPDRIGDFPEFPGFCLDTRTPPEGRPDAHGTTGPPADGSAPPPI